MSFDKNMGKDWRKQFTGSKAFDPACRNHGACSYCSSNRTWFDKKYRQAAEQAIEDYYNDDYYDDHE